MADPTKPTGGSSQTESLSIEYTTNADGTAAKMENLTAVAVENIKTIAELEKATDKETAASKKNSEQKQSNIQLAEQLNAANKERLRLAAELQKVQDAEVDAATAYLAKLEEMVATYNMSTEALQRYKAEQLNVSAGAAPMIAAMEDMRLATEKYGVTITKVEQIEAARLQWEKENIAILNGLRIDAMAEQAHLEESSQIALNAQRNRAMAENRAAAIRDIEEMEAIRLADIEKQKSAQIAFEAFKRRTMAENRAEAARLLEQQEQDAVALAEKEAIDEIRWAETSVKGRIAQLERLKAYQANPNISQATIQSTFGSAAINDLPNLAAMTAQYNEALTNTHRGQTAVTESTNILSSAFENNRVRTEAIVIAHEAFQGRLTRIPGSIMVMIEYLNSASIAMTGMSVGIIGILGSLGLLVYEMVKGEQQTKAFNEALIRTNNYSGETRSKLEALGHSVGNLQGNFKEAYTAAAELTRSGKFTSDQIAGITESVVGLEHAFGTKLNVTIKEFESLSVKGTTSASKGSLEVSKNLEKLDEQYHFVNASLMEEIIKLEQEGKAREASAIAIDMYKNETKRAAEEAIENIGWIEAGWNGVTKAVHFATQAMADIGKRNTAAQNLAKAQNSVDVLSTYADGRKIDVGDPKQVANIMGLADALRTLDFAKMALAVEDQKAADRAAVTQQQSEADHILITRAIQDKTLMKKSVETLQDKLQAFYAENKKLEEANPGYMDRNLAYLEERELAIVKEYSAKTKAAKDDGRKAVLEDEVAGYASSYKVAKEAADQDIKMVKEWAAEKQITRQTEYDSITAAYGRQLAALDALIAAETTSLNKYQNRTDAEAERTKKELNDKVRAHTEAAQKIHDAMEKSQEDVVKAAVTDSTKDYNAEIKQLENKIDKQKLLNAEVGKSEEEKALAKKSLEDEKNSQDELLVILLQIKGATEDLGPAEEAVNNADIEKLKKIIALRKEQNAQIKEGADLLAANALQKSIDKEYAQFNKKLGDDLASAIVDGGGRGFKKLMRDMELSFARLILRPILQPIQDGISSFLYPTATQAGGIAGAQGGGAVGSAIGLANAAASAYKALSGGFSAIGTTVADTTQGAMYSMGMTNQIASNGAFATGMGSAAQIGAGIYGGIKVGSAISGEYGSRSTVNAGTGIGTIAGAVLGGPIGAAIGGFIGGTLGGLANRMFGMGDKNVTAMGMRGNITDSGVDGTNYSNWHQNGGWFRSDKNGTDTSALDPSVVNSFKDGMSQLKAVSSGFAQSLGVNSTALTNYSKAFDITLTKDAAANQTAITGFFTTMADDMATKLVPTLAAFSKSGETASVTLQRLSDEFKATDSIAISLGKTANSMFRGTGLDTAAARERIIDASGGTSNAVSQATNYAKNFLTEAQRLAPVLATVNTAMASLGYTGIDTREKFAALVDGLITSGAIYTDTGAKQYASLMALSDAFATSHAATEDLTKSVQAVADEQKTLQDQYDKLTLSADAYAKKQRALIQDENKAIYDQVQARTALATAYKSESDALKQTIADNKAFKASLLAYKDGLLTGSLSAATPIQKLAETQSQYSAMLAKAKTGDKDALSGLTTAADAFLNADQVVKASSQEYIADRNAVMKDIQSVADILGSGQTDAEKQLAAMDTSVSQLISINEHVKSVAEILAEIAQLPTASSTKAKDAPLPSDTSVAMSTPLLKVVQAVIDGQKAQFQQITELQGLRSDIQTTTGQAISANAQIQGAAAEQIVQGQTQAAKTTNWKVAQLQESQIQ